MRGVVILRISHKGCNFSGSINTLGNKQSIKNSHYRVPSNTCTLRCLCDENTRKQRSQM